MLAQCCGVMMCVPQSVQTEMSTWPRTAWTNLHRYAVASTCDEYVTTFTSVICCWKSDFLSKNIHKSNSCFFCVLVAWLPVLAIPFIKFCVQIDLQWLVIHCDPYLAAKETCNELPPVIEDEPMDQPCEEQCPAGPPGIDGAPVSSRPCHIHYVT